MRDPRLEQPDDDVYSNTSVHDPATGGLRRLTWRELVHEQRKEINRLQRFATMVSDLDRNDHGRHEGDVDSAAITGFSLGNPHIRPGTIFAYGLYGRVAYRMPERHRRNDPDAWTVASSA